MWCLHVRAHGLPVGELPDGAHPPALFLQPPHATEASQWAPVSAALHETFPEFLLQIPTELPERVDELELGHLEEGLWFGLGCQEPLPVSQIGGIFVVVVVVVKRVVDVLLVVIPGRSVNAQHPGRQLSKQEKGAKEEGSVAQG